MNCPYCGTKISDNQVFCPKCGNRVVNHEITNTYEISDTKELEMYIGQNVGKIMSRKFSWPSFFLGVYYYLYRKMYLLSLLFMIVQVGITYAFYKLDLYSFNYATGELKDNYIYFVVSIFVYFIIQLIIAFKFNDLYINYANTKINKIKNKGTKLTKYEIEEKIKYSGGVNLLLPVLFILLINLFSFYLQKDSNKIIDKVSNNEYNLTTISSKGYIDLNEDNSFIWYKDKNSKNDNYYVGTYKVIVGKRAIKQAEKYKITTDSIADINNFYFIKFKYDRVKKDGITTTVTNTNYYYGVYKEDYHYIDLNNISGLDYIHLEKINKDQENS